MGKRKPNKRDQRHRTLNNNLSQNGPRRSRKLQFEDDCLDGYKSYSQDIIPWVSYGNFCLTWITVVPLVSIFVIYVSSFAQRFPISVSVAENPELAHISKNIFPVPISQNISLFRSYSVDYKQLIKIREENMKIYGYNYSSVIDRRVNLSLEEYRDVYDGKWPVIVSDIVPKWKAFNWTSEFLLKRYGKDRIVMKAVDKALSNAVSLALDLKTFHSHIQEGMPTRWTYLEDELFIPKRPELHRDIGSCMYLEDDMFQLFPEEVRPWNAMLLWGTKFSRSALHMDPYNWTGTNAVLKGRKRWKLFPPTQKESHLYVMKNQKSGFPLNCYKYNSPVDGYDPDLEDYPLFSKVQPLVFDQLPGELLLIPTGWFHQAFNVEETMAISSQVMNSNNYRIILEEIIKAGNVRRNKLPRDIDELIPTEQVKTIMKLLPKSLLRKGKAVTDDALRQVNSLEPQP